MPIKNNSQFALAILAFSFLVIDSSFAQPPRADDPVGAPYRPALAIGRCENSAIRFAKQIDTSENYYAAKDPNNQSRHQDWKKRKLDRAELIHSLDLEAGDFYPRRGYYAYETFEAPDPNDESGSVPANYGLAIVEKSGLHCFLILHVPDYLRSQIASIVANTPRLADQKANFIAEALRVFAGR